MISVLVIMEKETDGKWNQIEEAIQPLTAKVKRVLKGFHSQRWQLSKVAEAQ